MKPNEKEEQYFKEQELKQRQQQATEQQHKAAEDEKHRLQDDHWMHCPKCGQILVTKSYGHAVEIDVCPSCKGVWLDATELDTILESAEKTNPLRAFLKIFGK